MSGKGQRAIFIYWFSSKVSPAKARPSEVQKGKISTPDAKQVRETATHSSRRKYMPDVAIQR
jgi:hypothetical protein